MCQPQKGELCNTGTCPARSTEQLTMPQSFERTDEKYGIYSCDGSPIPAAPASNAGGPSSPISALTSFKMNLHANDEQTPFLPAEMTAVEQPTVKGLAKGLNGGRAGGKKARKSKTDDRYLGVRVRMPVRDMLRNIRIANGADPMDLQMKQNKGSNGDRKRVNTSAKRKNTLKRGLERAKILEELAFIVEVLEEDLKASRFQTQPNKNLSSTDHKQEDKMFSKKVYQDLQLPLDESPPTQNCSPMTKKSPTQSDGFYNPLLCFTNTEAFAPCPDTQWEYNRGEQGRQGEQHGITSSTRGNEYYMASQQEATNFNPSMDYWWGASDRVSSSSVQEEWNSMVFFQSQVEREESILSVISNQELLVVNENGKTLLHRAADEGKRALVYVVARRMADLKKLNIKDRDGKTALHLAAQRNQHLIVADLLSLGANINEKDLYGKTCLHLSAEKGYVRVLEVLKSCMKNGVYIDLDAKDVNGFSALQHASVALKSTVQELEKNIKMEHARLRTLRKEQIMETLECLLQMECNAHYLDPGSSRFHQANDLPVNLTRGHLEAVSPVTQLLIQDCVVSAKGGSAVN